MNDTELTLDWIISTLKKSGINSKQVVIDRLEKAEYKELVDLANTTILSAIDKCYVDPKELTIKKTKKFIDPRD